MRGCIVIVLVSAGIVFLLTGLVPLGAACIVAAYFIDKEAK